MAAQFITKEEENIEIFFGEFLLGGGGGVTFPFFAEIF